MQSDGSQPKTAAIILAEANSMMPMLHAMKMIQHVAMVVRTRTLYRRSRYSGIVNTPVR